MDTSETNFSRQSPDLTDCGATGKLIKAEEQMLEAIAFHPGGLEKDGLKEWVRNKHRQIDKMST